MTDNVSIPVPKTAIVAGLKRLGGWLIVIAFGGGLAAGAIYTGGGGLLSRWIADALPFTITSLILLGVSLTLVYISQWVRARPWFDADGPSREMKVVQGRIGTKSERQGDSVACAIQYAGTTILLGIVILTYFIAHHG